MAQKTVQIANKEDVDALIERVSSLESSINKTTNFIDDLCDFYDKVNSGEYLNKTAANSVTLSFDEYEEVILLAWITTGNSTSSVSGNSIVYTFTKEKLEKTKSMISLLGNGTYGYLEIFLPRTTSTIASIGQVRISKENSIEIYSQYTNILVYAKPITTTTE